MMQVFRGLLLITLLCWRVKGDYYYSSSVNATYETPTNKPEPPTSSENSTVPGSTDTSIPSETITTDTLRSVIEDQSNLISFRKSLMATELMETVLGNLTANLTVFAPSDDAIKASDIWTRYLQDSTKWKTNLRHTVTNHFVDGMMSATEVYEAAIGSIESWEDMLENNPDYYTIENAKIEKTFKTANGYLHITDGVFRPKFFDVTLADMDNMPELGSDQEAERRLALTDVVDFLDVRDRYSQLMPEGMTHIACRIRAFNRMEDYLTQTINDSPNVKYGELMNASFKDESIYNFVEYSIINKVYDSDSIQHGYEELIMSQNKLRTYVGNQTRQQDLFQ
jgi:uncharacterized surface protein with fasciclin (FAS1) repeats